MKHKDVYKDEFPRLQKAGVFKGTAEQADSLVTHVFELCQKFYSKDYGYGGCVFNPPEQRGRNGGKDVDMVDMPLALAAVAGEFTILLDTLNTCPDYKFPVESPTVNPRTAAGLPQAKASFVRLGQMRYRITNVKPGSAYRAFSLNGQLSESGFLDGDIFVAPSYPVILMLNDGQSLYLKN